MKEIESIIVTVTQTEQIGIDEFKDIKISKEFDLLDSFKDVNEWCKLNKSSFIHASISVTLKP